MVDREPAWAKVNLYLHVTGRRPDGYHLLDSLVVFVGAQDMVEGEAAETLTLEISGPESDSLAAGNDNLVMRAAEALRSATGIRTGAALRLHKTLPVASGIGGGSADAAATLRLLNRLWGTGLSCAELCRIAGTLGADVPACVLSRPLRMTGIGEVLAPLDQIPPLHLVLVNPRLPVATPAVFARRLDSKAPFSEAAATPRLSSTAEFIADLGRSHNDLEAAAIQLEPVIGEVLSALRVLDNCRLARMSGSGATCFALFDNPGSASEAARLLQSNTDWWVWSGALA
ncbi:MAG: 4-(cytidine 5'-diphospho)-2-C-methyl-D-erythritol kinase [Alphaproteobacteria bacterium]|nr:MAG: 4-(cytidine 5'-diphospho)-2-C-methyl-D-erythritol kinase [Alphaproteobacteria bacterium]